MIFKRFSYLYLVTYNISCCLKLTKFKSQSCVKSRDSETLSLVVLGLHFVSEISHKLLMYDTITCVQRKKHYSIEILIDVYTRDENTILRKK